MPSSRLLVLALLPAAAFGAGVLLGDDARSGSAPAGPERWSPPPAHLVAAAPAPALPSAARAVPAASGRAPAPAGERSFSITQGGSAAGTEPFLGTDAFVP